MVIDIFVIAKNHLYTAEHEEDESDAFTELFTKWQDAIFLTEYFLNYKSDLESGFFGDISIEDAVVQTKKEALEWKKEIITFAEKGTLENTVFVPLHKEDNTLTHKQVKSYGSENPSWLRVYAIRIAQDVFVVSGGGIKLTASMSTPELKKELERLKETAVFLKEIGLTNEEDLGYIEFKQHGETD